MKLVAAYCRVSTDGNDQANSFENQKQYFDAYIKGREDWELYQIYADEGVSGTGTTRREAFKQMIADARLHCFDMIITKEVSRFSRNVIDTLRYSRELREMGIGIYFLNDSLNTLDGDAELRLTIMASFAQEESRRISQRVKWGQTRQMEKGVVFGRSMLGYEVNKGKMSIDPDGAKIVQAIFHKYVDERKNCGAIARELREAGCYTLRGSLHWSNTAILHILKNEKYCGDILQKKTFTPDYLTHSKRYNHGQEKKIYIRDHHEAIISRELWEAAQKELSLRDLDKKNEAGHGRGYILSGRIKCGECGAVFVSRKKKRKNGDAYICWRCATATYEGGKRRQEKGSIIGCDIGCQLRDETAFELIRRSLDSLTIDKAAAAVDIAAVVADVMTNESKEEKTNAGKLKDAIRSAKEKKRRVIDAFLEDIITKKELEMMTKAYDDDIVEHSLKLAALQAKRTVSCEEQGICDEIVSQLKEIITEGGGSCFYGTLLDHITVYKEKNVEICLKQCPVKWIYSPCNNKSLD